MRAPHVKSYRESVCGSCAGPWTVPGALRLADFFAGRVPVCDNRISKDLQSH